jgi:hypothetical protein
LERAQTWHQQTQKQNSSGSANSGEQKSRGTGDQTDQQVPWERKIGPKERRTLAYMRQQQARRLRAGKT